MARLPSLRMGRVPDAPALSVRDPWPGDATRGARLIKGELEIGGAVQPLRQGGWRAWTARPTCGPARTASPGCAICARSAPMPPACGPAALVADWITSPPPDPIAHRPDVVGARITAWLGHYDFFAATADDAFRQRLMAPPGRRRPQPVGGDAGRGTRCPRADRPEGPGRRGGGVARARRLPGPRAALPAAGDQPPDPARRLPRRTQPGRATRRAAGPDRNPCACCKARRQRRRRR